MAAEVCVVSFDFFEFFCNCDCLCICVYMTKEVIKNNIYARGERELKTTFPLTHVHIIPHTVVVLPTMRRRPLCINSMLNR